MMCTSCADSAQICNRDEDRSEIYNSEARISEIYSREEGAAQRHIQVTQTCGDLNEWDADLHRSE